MQHTGEENSEECGIVTCKEEIKEEIGINEREHKELARLCAQASLAELYSLVEELHYRRGKNGIDLADYELQARLKALIYLIHRHGNLARGAKRADQGLLRSLKKAGAKLEGLKPTGLIRELLRGLSASWPELITLFWTLLSMPGMEGLLGGDLFKGRHYLEFNRFLYFLFLTRLARQGCGKHPGDRFLFADDKIKAMLRARPRLLGIYRKLDRGRPSGWAEQIPLLRVGQGGWLLSPELLYDNLLENYAKVMDAYAHRPKQSLVAEEGANPFGLKII